MFGATGGAGGGEFTWRRHRLGATTRPGARVAAREEVAGRHSLRRRAPASRRGRSPLEQASRCRRLPHASSSAPSSVRQSADCRDWAAAAAGLLVDGAGVLTQGGFGLGKDVIDSFGPVRPQQPQPPPPVSPPARRASCAFRPRLALRVDRSRSSSKPAVLARRRSGLRLPLRRMRRMCHCKWRRMRRMCHCKWQAI